MATPATTTILGNPSMPDAVEGNQATEYGDLNAKAEHLSISQLEQDGANNVSAFSISNCILSSVSPFLALSHCSLQSNPNQAVGLYEELHHCCYGTTTTTSAA